MEKLFPLAYGVLYRNFGNFAVVYEMERDYTQ